MIAMCSSIVMARFSLKSTLGQCRFGRIGCWQPIHVEGEVVDSAQENVGCDGPVFSTVQEVFGLRLDQQRSR